MTDLVDRLRANAGVDGHIGCGQLFTEAADEIERLRAEVLEQCRLNGMGGSREAKLRAEVEQQRLELGITEDACGMLESEVKQLRARVAELEAYIDFFDPMTKCARCGVEKRQTSLIPEEGDEWECFECWERENARERAALMKGA